VAAVGAAALSCERAAPPPSEPPPGPAQSELRTASPAPGLADTTATAIARDFTAEAYRAELDAGGLFVDAGTLDLHKYTRGAWRTGWQRNRPGAPMTGLAGARSSLVVELRNPVRSIVARGSAAGGRLVVSANGRSVGALALPRKPGTASLALARPLAPGRYRIELRGARRAALDWIWFATAAAASPADAPDEPRTADGALAAPSPRRFSYYLVPEAGATLRVAPGGGGTAAIEATVDGAGTKTLWSGEATGKPVRRSLTEFAGRAVRLDFASSAGSVVWRAPAVEVPRPAPTVKSGRDARNVIVLLVDTVRADAFGAFSGEAGIGARAYERLAASGTAFRNAYNNENWTKPSIATLNSGLYPGTHGARWRRDRCSSDLLFLSEHLRGQGFATAAFVSNISAGPKFGFDQGWDSFTKTEDASDAFGRARAWLDARPGNKRFFLYVQTIDPHVPFAVPGEFIAPDFRGPYRGKLGQTFEQSEEEALNGGSLRLNDTDRRWLRALYNGEIRYHDRYLGEFIAYLERTGTLDDTLFVALNDHGEEFGEHGRWGHGWTMGDALFRSPLVFRFAPRFARAVRDEVVEHVDVAPTIADVLGVPPLPDAEGSSLVGLERRVRPHAAVLFGRPKKRAVRVGPFKLVVDSRGQRQLYDVESDPDQKRDLLRSRPIAARLAEIALGEGLGNPRRADRLADHSPSVADAIKAEYIDE